MKGDEPHKTGPGKTRKVLQLASTIEDKEMNYSVTQLMHYSLKESVQRYMKVKKCFHLDINSSFY